MDQENNGLIDLFLTISHDQGASKAGTSQTFSVCPYCSVGCGLIVHTRAGQVVHVEGDPDHPVNEGSLCVKGAVLTQLVNNPERLTTPRYRAPGAAEWQEVTWDWALDAIADRVKTSRDRTFKLTSRSMVAEDRGDGQEVRTEREFVVNRTDGIASIGSCGLHNEECYLLQKLMRSWGIVYFDDKTRT